MDDFVLTAHLVSACIMVGVIWFVQLVHYPLLAVVPVESAKQVAEKHQKWTGIVVGPPMAVEGVSTLILWANTPPGVSWWLTWVNGASLANWINDVAVAYTDLTPAATQHQFPGGTDRVIKTSRGYTPVAGGRGAIYEMREREIAIDESGWFNIGSRDELNDAIERIFNAAG
jgi:hypothetical protein